jgi:hypothetical protein
MTMHYHNLNINNTADKNLFKSPSIKKEKIIKLFFHKNLTE